MREDNYEDRKVEAAIVGASETPALLSRVSWGAIISGIVISIGLLFLLGLLGSAIGFSSVDPQSNDPLGGIGIGAAIWWALASIISLGVGGFVAGRLSGMPDKASSTAHGASVWGLVTILTLWFAASAVGSVLNTATGALATVMETAAQAAEIDSLPTDEIEAQADEIARSIDPSDRQMVRERATRVADQSAETLSISAWYAFFASLLSLLAAVFAAGAGAPKLPVVTGRKEVEIS